MGRGSDRVVLVLRDRVPVADEVARARMRRRFVTAATSRGATGERAAAVTSTRGRFRGWTLPLWFAATAVALTLGVGRFVSSGASPGGGTRGGGYAGVVGNVPVRDAVSTGERVRAGASLPLEVALDDSRLRLAPATEVDFREVSSAHIHLVMGVGAIHVAFHPKAGRGQRMSIDTPTARVEVVGTEFDVISTPAGTTVRVSEGRVRMRAAGEDEWRYVGAGESATTAKPTPARTPAPASGLTPAPASARTPAPASGLTPAPASGLTPAPASGPTPRPAPPAARTPVLPPAPASRRTPPASAHPAVPAPIPVGMFDEPRELMAAGRHARARHLLYTIAASEKGSVTEAMAWELVAESWVEEGRPREAADAYRRASVSGRSDVSLRALVELARLRRDALDDVAGARVAFERYLSLAPRGPHAAEARAALRFLRAR